MQKPGNRGSLGSILQCVAEGFHRTTWFIDPDVVRALGIRSDLEDLFVELGMGNFATHPQVLYPELVRQFMATVNVY